MHKMGGRERVVLRVSRSHMYSNGVSFIDVFNISCCNLATIECHVLTLWTHILLLGQFIFPSPPLLELHSCMFCQQLSSWSTVVEKLVVTQIVRYLAFQQTQMFITVFTSAGQWSILSHMTPLPSCHISVNVCLQNRIMGFANSKCETASCTSTSFWNLLPSRCFFRWAEKMELTWYKVRVVQHI